MDVWWVEARQPDGDWKEVPFTRTEVVRHARIDFERMCEAAREAGQTALPIPPRAYRLVEARLTVLETRS